MQCSFKYFEQCLYFGISQDAQIFSQGFQTGIRVSLTQFTESRKTLIHALLLHEKIGKLHIGPVKPKINA